MWVWGSGMFRGSVVSICFGFGVSGAPWQEPSNQPGADLAAESHLARRPCAAVMRETLEDKGFDWFFGV